MVLVAFLIQLSFRVQCSAACTGHLLLVPKVTRKYPLLFVYVNVQPCTVVSTLSTEVQ